jgi:hypothetical protein
MSFVWRHPSLTAIEAGWRWLFGLPFLVLVWNEAQKILAAIPPESVGLDRLNFQNPWVSSLVITDAIGSYAPAVTAVLRWLLPVGVLIWAVVSGLGRMLLLRKMRALDAAAGQRWNLRGFNAGYFVLQALWMAILLACWWLWYEGVGWACGKYILGVAQPDLVAYLCWLIFISLGAFTLWAAVSWTLSMAPLILMLETTTILGALRRSFALGRPLSGKLMEVSLVMAIVKIALIVLAMVFSAAPLPFSDTFGPDTLHWLNVLIVVGFLIGNDYFYVVRVRSFVELWRHYCGNDVVPLRKLASDIRIRRYSSSQDEFFAKVFDGEYSEIWVSDKSSLHDFATQRSLEPYFAKIREVYGVDVSDIEGALLWKILQRIGKKL